MLLAIDAGNTNIVFAACKGDAIRAQWRAATKTSRTADEYAAWLKEMLSLEHLRFADLDAAIIASVVPAALFDLRSLCRRYLNCEALVVGDASVELGIGVHAERPAAVGADRLGDYEGGVIAPGANLSAEALHQAAAMLPRVAIERTQSVIGKDTIPAVQSGLYWGYVGLIEGLVARIKAEYGQPMTVIATGGLAALFHKQVAVINHLDPDLTISGLIRIHARNAKK